MARARLSVEIPLDLQERLRTNIPWGLQGPIINKLLISLMDILEKNPLHKGIILAAFISGDITTLHLLEHIEKMGKEEQRESK